MPSNNLILCCPLLLLPSIFPSIRVFFNELALCIRWPKYWIFNFSISPSNKHSGLISFRINWSTFDENIHSYQTPCLLHQSLPHLPCLHLLPPCPAGAPGWPLPRALSTVAGIASPHTLTGDASGGLEHRPPGASSDPSHSFSPASRAMLRASVRPVLHGLQAERDPEQIGLDWPCPWKCGCGVIGGVSPPASS